ncbi:MAG: hypothetical protein ACOX7P_00825 [Oscillospiraceae bacterium]|jgi:5-deoxy-glucuronate isomerase
MDNGLFTHGVRHSQAAAPGGAMYYLWVIHYTVGNEHVVPPFAKEHQWVLSPDANIYSEL